MNLPGAHVLVATFFLKPCQKNRTTSITIGMQKCLEVENDPFLPSDLPQRRFNSLMMQIFKIFSLTENALMTSIKYELLYSV